MGKAKKDYLFFEQDGNIEDVKGKQIAVIGYGNQGRSQALNMRDSGLSVIIGNRDDKYKEKAVHDKFEVFDPQEAVAKGDIIFLLIPDEDMPSIFEEMIKPALIPGKTVVFASGYNVGFNLLKFPKTLM